MFNIIKGRIYNLVLLDVSNKNNDDYIIDE